MLRARLGRRLFRAEGRRGLNGLAIAMEDGVNQRASHSFHIDAQLQL